MNCNENDVILSKNLRTLRKYYGLTQQEVVDRTPFLQKKVNEEVVTNTCSKVELGKRRLYVGEAWELCRLYNMSLDVMSSVLIETDASVKEKVPVNGEQEKIWFPACLEVTEGFDDSFKEGVRAFKRYHCGDTVNESKLKELFLSSWETSRRKEALVNYLSAVFCESMQYGAQLPERRLNYIGNIPRKLLLGPHTHSDKRSDFIKNNYHGILSAIDTLKSDPQWRDIGDYYYAVRFLCGMMDEVLGNDAGVWLGGVMIAELKETGNKYAARLTEIINDSLL